jgi:hypothetical protein
MPIGPPFCSALQFHKAGHLAAVALTIVMLVNFAAAPGRAAFDRFLEVGLGILVQHPSFR